MSPTKSDSSPDIKSVSESSDNDKEIYNLEKIDQFLNEEGTKNKPVHLTDDMEIEVTEE